MNFQELILALEQFWANQGCVIQQPCDLEVGAGTFNPATFLRSLGPEPWNVAYVEPSRRPADGRYGDNPNRLGFYYQYQVILKPAPYNVQDIFLDSLRHIGLSPENHDIRFVEDDWESPTLGAWGLGWEVWIDGMETIQYTYFQQVGGIDLPVTPVELTYGLERMAMYQQNVDSVFDLEWVSGVTYCDVHHQSEVEYSTYHFDEADIELHTNLFDIYERESTHLIDRGLVLPAYDYVLKCSHTFNLLEARGAISVSERASYVQRVRTLAKGCAELHLKQREELGWPLLKKSASAGKGDNR